MEICWVIEDRLCLFGRPGDENEMRDIAEKAGLGLLIQLFDPARTEEVATDWTKTASEMNFEVKRIETPDFGVPKIDASGISDLAKHAREAFDADEAVGIHCGAGIGRTGTMALLLVAELIRQSGSCSENDRQLAFIQDYLKDSWVGRC
jgi:protein-tyrosine phosphatase